MSNRYSPVARSVRSGTTVGRRLVLPIQGTPGRARILVPPEQGVGNGRSAGSRHPVREPRRGDPRSHRRSSEDSSPGWSPVHRMSSEDSSPRRFPDPRMDPTGVTAPQGDVGEHGGHTVFSRRRNGYLYCADTSHIVSSVSKPHKNAGIDVRLSPTGLPTPTDPVESPGAGLESPGRTEPTRPDRADVTLARATVTGRLPPTQGWNTVALGDEGLRPPERDLQRRRNTTCLDGADRPGGRMLDGIQCGSR